MRTKQLNKALDDLAEEGVVQLFKPVAGSLPILGVVGTLQLDVLTSRLKAEYGVSIRTEQAPYQTARWIGADDPKKLQDFIDLNRSAIAEDKNGDPVFMVRNDWALGRATEEAPDIRFMKTRERS
jgi:peptide chain release factor 3